MEIAKHVYHEPQLLFGKPYTRLILGTRKATYMVGAGTMSWTLFSKPTAWIKSNESMVKCRSHINP
jgi:hypothetical protein